MSVFGLRAGQLGLFAFAVLLLALTPGPVWIYLISRTLTQGTACRLLFADRCDGRRGRAPACAAFGLVGDPAGACRPRSTRSSWPARPTCCGSPGTTLRGAGFSFTPQPLDPVPDRVLLRQSLTASVINPKVAVFYLSLFPQFVDPASGSVLLQSLAARGRARHGIDAGRRLARHRRRRASSWLAQRPSWLRVQRWFLGGAFGVLAVWLALTPRQQLDTTLRMSAVAADVIFDRSMPSPARYRARDPRGI